MGRGNLITGGRHFHKDSTSHLMLFFNMHKVLHQYLFKHFRKFSSFRCVITIIIVSICLPCVYTHNKNYRYNRIHTLGASHFPRRSNTVLSIAFRGYFSPTRNTQRERDAYHLPHESLSRTASRRISNDVLPTFSMAQTDRKLLRYSRNLPKNILEDAHNETTGVEELAKVSFNTSYIPKASIRVEDHVLVDSYRSSSVCIGHRQTHWLRDSKNCSMFFVCARNRVSAVLTCPSNYVWSNRVTNCVPLNSRWDDCSFKHRLKLFHQTSTLKGVNYDSGDNIISQDEPQNTQYPVIKGYREEEDEKEEEEERQPIEHQPPPISPPSLQLQQQQQFPRMRRRLGYRSGGLARDTLKRRRFSSRGYVIQWLNKNKNKRRRLQRNNLNHFKKHTIGVTENFDTDSSIKHRGQQIWGVGGHISDHEVSTTERRWYSDVTTDTSTTTPTPTTKPSLKSVIMRKRRRRKNRQHIKHSLRLKSPITISSSPNDYHYFTKSRENKNHNPNHIQDKYPPDVEHTTSETVVTKWWKTSDVATSEPTETVTSTPQTTTTVNTTLPRYSTLTTTTHPSRAFIPECGVSAAPMIVGGMPVQDDRWPWVVSLRLTWLNRNMCGGTLVHPRWLVTAAHCMAEPDLSHPEEWRVVFKNVDAPAKVDFIVKHPSFINGDNFPNDIAMLRLKHPVDVTGFHIRHACLPPKKWNRSQYEKCWIMGWGEAKEDTSTVLNELEVNIWKNSECSARWGWKRILNSHICVGTGDKGACNGDSGGPLICRQNGYHFLAGVTSWGVHGCQTNGYPAVFVNVASYRKWIDEVVKNYSI